MLLEPILQVLLTLLTALVAATALVGATAPRYLTTAPARLERIRVHLIFWAVMASLVLVLLWSGYLGAWVAHAIGWALLGLTLGGAALLPRDKRPWRFSIGALVGAFFLGGACWFGVSDFWDFVARGTGLPAFPRSWWVAIPMSILVGAWLHHRFAEIEARVRGGD